VGSGKKKCKQSDDLCHCHCHCHRYSTSDAARSGASCRMTCFKFFAFTSDLTKRKSKKRKEKERKENVTKMR
jgi:hypothetical protein